MEYWIVFVKIYKNEETGEDIWEPIAIYPPEMFLGLSFKGVCSYADDLKRQWLNRYQVIVIDLAEGDIRDHIVYKARAIFGKSFVYQGIHSCI